MELWALDEVHFQQHGSRCRTWIAPEIKRPVLVNVLSGVPYGYRYLKKTDGSDSCYVIHENEAPILRQVYQ